MHKSGSWCLKGDHTPKRRIISVGDLFVSDIHFRVSLSLGYVCTIRYNMQKSSRLPHAMIYMFAKIPE
jgi:hypothetical protein